MPHPAAPPPATCALRARIASDIAAQLSDNLHKKGTHYMGLKSDLSALAKFADNPFDAKYRPEKEMKRLYALLLITLPLFLGFSSKFFILATGPLFIYWIVVYFRAIEYWKALKWKMWIYVVPTIIMALFGLYLSFTELLFKIVGWFFGNVVFYK